jgi:hypothetical protein
MIVRIGRSGRMMIGIGIWSGSFGGARLGFGRPGVGFGRIECGVWEKDPDGKGSEGVDVDVLGGDAVSEGRVGSGYGLIRAGGNSERVGLVGRRLDPVLQPVLQKELEENAVQLHSYGWHFQKHKTRSLSLSLPPPGMCVCVGFKL